MQRQCRASLSLITTLGVCTLAAACGSGGSGEAGDDGAADGGAATVNQVFDGIACEPREGIRFCQGSIETRVPTFDGVPLDVDVGLPPASAGPPPYPLIVRMHGYSGTKEGPVLGGADSLTAAKEYAEHGFAVMNFTARGRGESCGSPESRAVTPDACAQGWDHLGDTRRSIRDVQYLAGRLVDQGIAEPGIGVQGGSYGGGRSVSLATLRDRVQLPDGSYAPWTSPEKGIPMHTAAAVPFIAWSDLAYGLAPNGRVLDYAIAPYEASRQPLGALKESAVTALFAAGQQHYNAPPGADPSIDLYTWYQAYQSSEFQRDIATQAAIELAENHSALGIPITRQPAPTLFANGFTDDIFPVTHALRWINRVRQAFPEAEIAQLYGDFGHRRADQNSAALLRPRALRWFQHHMQGRAVDNLPTGVEAFVQLCDGDADGFGERYAAEEWHDLAQGELRLQSQSVQIVNSSAENPTVSSQVDPVSGRFSPVNSGSCRTVDRVSTPGTASYLTAPSSAGFTLLGSPTIHLDLSLTAARAEDALIVGRLWDVSPDGATRTLVARRAVRPPSDSASYSPAGFVFQLPPNAYRFEPGHRAELQLLGRSTAYVRPPNTAFMLEIMQMELRLPVAEPPSAAADIDAPAPRVLPAGYEWAPGYGPAGSN